MENIHVLRMYPPQDALEPLPSLHVSALCCFRVAAVRGNVGVQLAALPHRDLRDGSRVGPAIPAPGDLNGREPPSFCCRHEVCAMRAHAVGAV